MSSSPFLFGSTGGDVAKAYYLATGEGREKKTAAAKDNDQQEASADEGAEAEEAEGEEKP